MNCKLVPVFLKGSVVSELLDGRIVSILYAVRTVCILLHKS